MTCQNCGNNLKGNFCSSCGEKKLSKHDLSIKHFFLEGVESFFHLDNKFFRTLKVLLVKPGKLSVDFVEGRRVRFMKPIQLFLLLNILLFLSPGNPFSLPLYNYMNYGPFTNYNTKETVAKKLNENQVTLENITIQFNQSMHTASKSFLFLYIPFYAILFFIFFWYKKKNFTEHLVFASHFISFYLLFYILNLFLIIKPFYYFTGNNYSETYDIIHGIFITICIIVFLFFATKRFYNASNVMAIFCSVSVGISFIIVLQLYRMLLFFKIFTFDI